MQSAHNKRLSCVSEIDFDENEIEICNPHQKDSSGSVLSAHIKRLSRKLTRAINALVKTGKTLSCQSNHTKCTFETAMVENQLDRAGSVCGGIQIS